jgi:hypothetical protein
MEGLIIFGWFTTSCCKDIPIKAGLTVYMVGLSRFVVKMYPLSQVLLYIWLVYHDLLYRCTL